MKTNVLFVSNPMWTGGIEKSLLSVFSILDPGKFNVTLLLTEKTGDLLDKVPKWVKTEELPLRPEDRFALNHFRIPVLKHCLMSGHWFYAVRMLWQRFLWDVCGRSYDFDLHQVAEMVKRVDKSEIQTEYDFAFAYAGGDWSTCVVRYLIKAPVTAVWFHDESLKSRFKKRDVREVFSYFTYRYGVSDQLTGMLNDSYAGWGGTFVTMPFILDFDLYRSRAAELPEPAFSGEKRLKLLTVARLCPQKGIDHAIEIASWLKRDGYSFCWYVVGNGEQDEPGYRRMIESSDVADVFILLGKRDNPYPYFRDCDIYLQPSRFEAYCLAISEAKAFCKPIVATDFAGARDQIVDGETGIITPLNDLESFCNAIRRLLDDCNLRLRLSDTLRVNDPKPPRAAIEKWGKLLDKEPERHFSS